MDHHNQFVLEEEGLHTDIVEVVVGVAPHIHQKDHWSWAVVDQFVGEAPHIHQRDHWSWAVADQFVEAVVVEVHRIHQTGHWPWPVEEEPHILQTDHSSTMVAVEPHTTIGVPVPAEVDQPSTEHHRRQRDQRQEEQQPWQEEGHHRDWVWVAPSEEPVEVELQEVVQTDWASEAPVPTSKRKLHTTRRDPTTTPSGLPLAVVHHRKTGPEVELRTWIVPELVVVAVAHHSCWQTDHPRQQEPQVEVLPWAYHPAFHFARREAHP
jgi:hypothetical protein